MCQHLPNRHCYIIKNIFLLLLAVLYGVYDYCYDWQNLDVLLTVHLSIFISVINQIDAQNFCFTISLSHASTCFEHMCSGIITPIGVMIPEAV